MAFNPQLFWNGIIRCQGISGRVSGKNSCLVKEGVSKHFSFYAFKVKVEAQESQTYSIWHNILIRIF